MAGPLAGIRVLDFTHALAGPFGTMVLGDLGAEVINIQRVADTDASRGFGPYVNGRSTYRFSIERGKLGMQLDITKPAGLDVALRLAERSDVLAENFSVGVMDRLGLGYDVVSARNPRIIYASCTGFGQTGPYKNRDGVDIVAQAMSGLMSITGEADGRPMRAGASFGDTVSGLTLATGVIAALYERERSGRGQRVEVSMVESLVYHLENAVIRYSATGESPVRIGPRHPLSTPFQPFETKDGWMVVAGVRDWEAFCTVIGREDLALEPAYATAAGRTQAHAVLEPILIAAFRTRTRQEWMAALEGIAMTAPVNSIADMVGDPHMQARRAVVPLPVPGPEPCTVLVANAPFRLSRTPAAVDTPGPGVGEHTASVLERVLGMSEEECARLEQAGIVKMRRQDA